MSRLIETLRILLDGKAVDESEYTIDEQKAHLIEDIATLKRNHDRYRAKALDAEDAEYNALYR